MNNLRSRMITKYAVLLLRERSLTLVICSGRNPWSFLVVFDVDVALMVQGGTEVKMGGLEGRMTREIVLKGKGNRCKRLNGHF